MIRGIWWMVIESCKECKFLLLVIVIVIVIVYQSIKNNDLYIGNIVKEECTTCDLCV